MKKLTKEQADIIKRFVKEIFNGLNNITSTRRAVEFIDSITETDLEVRLKENNERALEKREELLERKKEEEAVCEGRHCKPEKIEPLTCEESGISTDIELELRMLYKINELIIAVNEIRSYG